MNKAERGIMANKSTADALRCVLTAFGALTVLYSIVISFFMNFNVGVIMVLLVGVYFTLTGVFFKSIFSSAIMRWLLYISLIAVLFIAALCIFIVARGKNDNATQTEDAVIVLGAGINGSSVTPQLASRLDAAAEYCMSNKDVVIVVSGGQGPQEDITEALAMERYLTEKGISPERILREEESVSTYTNLTNSKAILDTYFDGEYSVLIITSEYHIYRASETAADIGLCSTHIHSPTAWYELPVRSLRESAAVLKRWLLGS